MRQRAPVPLHLDNMIRDSGQSRDPAETKEGAAVLKDWTFNGPVGIRQESRKR